MITLYGSMASRAHRVVWMLKELAVPFEHVPVSFTDGSTRRPEFLRINPNGRVPVLDDGGFVIYESMAINLYLARKHGGPLAPDGIQEESLAAQWSFWVVTEIEKPLLFAAANRRLFSTHDESLAAIGLNKLDRPLKVLDAHLAKSAWLLGDRFTVADLNVATVMDLAPQCGISLNGWPNVKAWHEHCLARPAASDWASVSFEIPRPADALGLLRMFL